MSEDPNKDNNNPPANDPGKANNNPPASGGEGGGESPFKNLMSEKNFKSEDEAVKYIKDLEEKSTKTNEEAETYRKYYPYALAFSSYLKSNPEAMKAYQEWAKGSGDGGEDNGDKGKDGGDGNPPAAPKDTGARQDISELMGIEKDRVLSNFDAKYGLSKLEDVKYRDIAGRMGATIKSWGIDLQSPTVEMIKRLPKALEDAYILVRSEDAKKEGKIEGFLQATEGERGKIPTIPAVSIDNPDTITEESLSEEEKKVAANMGLTPKDYAASKKEMIAGTSKK